MVKAVCIRFTCTVYRGILSTYFVPDRIFWKGSAKEVILPTLTGQMGVLTNHIPLLTGLDIVAVLIRDQVSLEWKPVIVTGGFALVNNNNITILVNEAELGLQIDYQEAESVLLETKLALDGISDPKKKIEIKKTL